MRSVCPSTCVSYHYPQHIHLKTCSSRGIARVVLMWTPKTRQGVLGLTVTSYKDHFEQRPIRTRVTISYKSIGVTSNKDILYVVVPKILHSISYKDHFIQRRPYKNPRVNFVIEFFDRVRFCFCFFFVLKF